MFFHHGEVYDDITLEEYYNLPDPPVEKFSLPNIPPVSFYLDLVITYFEK